MPLYSVMIGLGLTLFAHVLVSISHSISDHRHQQCCLRYCNLRASLQMVHKCCSLNSTRSTYFCTAINIYSVTDSGTVVLDILIPIEVKAFRPTQLLGLCCRLEVTLLHCNQTKFYDSSP